MAAAPLPTDEAQRLATLQAYNILDTPPERSFDRVVQLAAEHFDVPMSLVSLVDADRQWFKASVGVDSDGAPRDTGFCPHVIVHSDDVMVVEDATLDPRFADNPLVTGDPSIQFYAGAVIRAENGQPLGTLCIVDNKPRQMDVQGRGFLAKMAANVGSLIELHRKNQVLAARSGTDPLTGLANRRVFDTRLAEACAAASDDAPFGLLMFDLDDFKAVNDDFGHDVGDSLLREVAARLRHVVRDKDLVARLGGDEFAVIAAAPVDLNALHGMARRIMTAFSLSMMHQAQAVPIRASIGIALAPLHGAEPRLLSRAADLALYRSKRTGGQLITEATMSEDAKISPDLLRQQELRDAISTQALELYWQPYLEPRSRRIVGYEALLRWHRPGRDPVSPLDMVAWAERGGFIDSLDESVMHRACRAAATWPQPLQVSVNLSAWWFNEGDVAGMINAALAASGLAPGRLTVELTEGTLVRHTEQARGRISTLHAMGVHVALDDFGTGFASLGYLCDFNFDKVKLDRTFVHGLGSNPRAEAVAQAVLALSRALDLMVCAEGVETEAQLTFLQEAGCDLVQGYLLGRPQPNIRLPDAQVEPATTLAPV